MDPRSSAQDVHRCDLCEAVIVHSYCDICHVNLCKPCIGEHISNEYDEHKIVPFQDRTSTLLYPKCGTHSNKLCKFQCIDCNDIFVCSCCVASETHARHRFVEMSNAYRTKKQTIEGDTEELENLIAPSYEEIALELENQLSNLDGGYHRLLTEISKQGEEWHKEIDIVIIKMKTEINEIKMKHVDILKKQLDEVKQIQSLITQTLLALKEIEQSSEVSTTIGYSSKNSELKKLPPKIRLSLPTFIPKPQDRKELYSLFGQITPLFTATAERVLSLNQRNVSAREFLDEPELYAKIQTGHGLIRSVDCLNENQIWTSGLTNVIECFSTEGKLLHQNITKSGINPDDLAVDRHWGLLYTIRETRTVFRVKNGRTEKLIKVYGWKLNNLYVTSTSDILVLMYSNDYTQSKLVRFSGSTEKQTIQFDDEGKPLFPGKQGFKHITENRNNDICVADSRAGAIVVVNQNGKLRWRYTGHPSVTCTKNEPFYPWGITTDSRIRILTADSNNHCIHILDQNGQFLRYIDNCGLQGPTGLCVDDDDNLFVSSYRKDIVVKIKYYK